MQVTLIAATEMYGIPRDLFNTKFGRRFNDRDNYWHSKDAPNDADTLAHFSGRACYQAWNMPREETSTDEGYLANIINQGHFSVLEHASATFYIEGVSRNLTHELIRHRHLSYSELSQRYVDMAEAKTVLHPTLREVYPAGGDTLKYTYLEDYEGTLDDLEQIGVTGKKAREAARGFLPGNVETKIVVTGNHRAWRDMLQKRYSVHADAEIQELATELLSILRKIAPATYQDFPDEPFQ